VIILVRHGQTDLNATGRLQGRVDVALNEVGRGQAAAVAAAVLGERGPVRVVSSPLLRARETAARFGLEVEVDERWIELDYGDWDGRPLKSIATRDWDQWKADPAFAPPNGESLVELGQRVAAACEDLAYSATDENVVVVSHVSPMKAAASWALGVGPELSWRMFLGVASICRISVGRDGPSLYSFNELSHLGGGTVAR
jgi:broad specificity phosphatase PhoE